MQASWEQGQTRGQMSNVRLLGYISDMCQCQATGPQGSPTATLNIDRAGEWILLATQASGIGPSWASTYRVLNKWLPTAECLRSYLNMPAQLCRKLFFFYIFDSCFASEQIYGHARRKQTLVLLPLQCLWEKKCTVIHLGAFKIWSSLLRQSQARKDEWGSQETEPSRPNHLWPPKQHNLCYSVCSMNTGWAQGGRGLWEPIGPSFHTYFLIGVTLIIKQNLENRNLPYCQHPNTATLALCITF